MLKVNFFLSFLMLLVVTEKVYEEVSTDASASESEDPGPAKQEPKKTQPAKQVLVTEYCMK